MGIFIYADESGVFDKQHQDFFVFGGIILLNEKEQGDRVRLYRNAENKLGPDAGRSEQGELKATTLSNKDKGKLFRSLNAVYKFAVVVDQKKIHDTIFDNKKTKQRYLDYAFKIGVKNALKHLVDTGVISANYSGWLRVIMDEHSTATDGCYELREGLEQEFKIGTHNYTYQKFFPPLFPNLRGVDLKLKDSRFETLVRAADIVANKVYFHVRRQTLFEISEKVILLSLP